jgi:TRAP-type C4-dicarboxylate transport system substrate-binding protein
MIMARKKLWSLMLGCLAACLFIAIAAAPGYGKTVELTYSNVYPVTHANLILANEWCKEIEKRTNGAVKITMFPGGTLTPSDQCYDGVVQGISDIGMSVVSYVKGRFPLSEVIDLPLGFKSGRQATMLANAYFEKFKPKEFDDVKIMYLMAHGPGIFHTKKPVEKLEDLKGVKIRSTGTTLKVVSACGAVPVAMPMPETYDALQKGVADGVVAPIEALNGWKLAEVIKSTTEDYGAAYSLLFFVAMNKKKWESLPKDVQEIIEKINKEWIEKSADLWDKIDKEGREYTLSKGNKIIQLSKEEDARWTAAVKPVLDDYVKSMKEKGLPGEEALNFCREWLKQHP